MTGLKTGKTALNEYLNIAPGVVTFQALDSDWLTRLAFDLFVHNHEPGQKMFYLQCLDYHERYQTFPFDKLVSTAKKAGVDVEELVDDLIVRRAFSRDAIESKLFWQELQALPPLSLVVMDSMTELYTEDSQKTYSRPMLFSIGRFRELCQKNECFGVALNGSSYLHPYLGDLSAVIIRFELGHRLFAEVLKHPLFDVTRFEVPVKAQRTLGTWGV